MQSRRDASLLMEKGHGDPFEYTLGSLWAEARLVRERMRAELGDQAVMMQTVVVAALSDPKLMTKFLKGLEDGE